MKIGIDVSQTGVSKAGCGFFTDNLIKQLACIDQKNHYLTYPTFGDHFWDPEFKKISTIKQCNFNSGLYHKTLLQAMEFWKSTSDNIENALGNVDLVHSNNFFCPTQLTHAKLVYTLFDLSFFEYPDCTTEHNRLACSESVFNASLFADFIICISNYTRQHFLNYFPHYPTNRIMVAPLASRFINNQSIPQPISLENIQPHQFWLNVGTLEPRKNIKRLLKAYAKFTSQEEKPYPLILAGKIGWLENDIDLFIKELGIAQHVHILGYVQNDELQWLYQHCFCFLFPSLFEGFGLPVLEAMSFGAPVISSRTSALAEIVGEAALLIDPLDEEDLLQAMKCVSQEAHIRKQLKEKGLLQARQFSWESTAKQVLRVYDEVMRLPKYALSSAAE